MENNQKIVLAVIGLLIGLAGGYYIGSVQGHSSGYEQARVDIKKQLEEKRIITATPKDIRVISGIIRSIEDGQFILESQLPYDPTVSAGTQATTISKTVLISSSTQIVARKVVANNTAPTAGQPFRPFLTQNVNIDFKSLKMSDQVVVEAGENIADKDSFTAVSVSKNGQ